MIAPKTRYHRSRHYIPVLFDTTDEKQVQVLENFVGACPHGAVVERLDDRFTVLRLYPGVREGRL